MSEKAIVKKNCVIFENHERSPYLLPRLHNDVQDSTNVT